MTGHTHILVIESRFNAYDIILFTITNKQQAIGSDANHELHELMIKSNYLT